MTEGGAIAHLFEEHHRPIFGFLLHASGDRAAAEDLTQEVFLRAHRALDGLERRGSDRAWLFRIARNLLIDRSRRHARRPRAVREPEQCDRATSAVQPLRATLAAALRTLTPEEREAFLLREVGGLSYREIAGTAGVSEAAVRNRIFRARGTLRGQLLELGPEKDTHEEAP